MSVAAEGRVL